MRPRTRVPPVGVWSPVHLIPLNSFCVLRPWPARVGDAGGARRTDQPGAALAVHWALRSRAGGTAGSLWASHPVAVTCSWTGTGSVRTRPAELSLPSQVPGLWAGPAAARRAPARNFSQFALIQGPEPSVIQVGRRGPQGCDFVRRGSPG